MRTRIFVGATLVASFLLSTEACSDLCGNRVIETALAPDGKTKALVFERDCGATTDFSTHVSILDGMQWQGVTDDPNGSGLLSYAIFRNSTYLASTRAPEFSDETVSASTATTTASWPPTITRTPPPPESASRRPLPARTIRAACGGF
jgi:hypothetical protein